MSPSNTAAVTTAVETAKDFVDKVNTIFLFPLIILMSSIAFLVFIYGCAEYIMNAESDQARETGKKHITFGLIGLVIMMSAYAILNLAVGTFGLSNQLDCANNPQAGCENSFKVTPPSN